MVDHPIDGRMITGLKKVRDSDTRPGKFSYSEGMLAKMRAPNLQQRLHRYGRIFQL
jgi:hypothetical protein